MEGLVSPIDSINSLLPFLLIKALESCFLVMAWGEEAGFGPLKGCSPWWHPCLWHGGGTR